MKKRTDRSFPANSRNAVAVIEKLLKKQLSEVSANDIQILAPIYKGPAELMF